MSRHNDQLTFNRSIGRVERRIKDIEKGTTETRPAPRFLPRPGDWQPLNPYLYPGWQVNDSGDLDDDETARFYLVGERVYLGGSIILSRADLGAHQDYAIAGSLPFSSSREIALGDAEENQNLSNTGWIGRTFGAFLTSIYVITGGSDDHIDDGTAISLEPFNYRITP